MDDTIFALSSGAPPAAIAIMRISGPASGAAILTLARTRPPPRVAAVRRLYDADGELLDQALVLWFPGPSTATGEDLVELHLHGGRAVVAAVERTLAAMPGLRRAAAGEFTRRAFVNGRIDLAEAEGLADLLSSETDLQRRQALALASGALSALIIRWRDAVLTASAMVEAVLDFGDEDDVEHFDASSLRAMGDVAEEIAAMLRQPRAEALREGFRVVLAGPPNSGKSSLFNRLVEDEAAITAPIAGTTRDVLTRPVAISGIPFLFVDTAGIRDDASDVIEAIGVERARGELDRADLVLWLGDEGEGEGKGGLVWEIESFADSGHPQKHQARHWVSAQTGSSLEALRSDLVETAMKAMPMAGSVTLNRQQHTLLQDAHLGLVELAKVSDPLIAAECLRTSRNAFDRLLGQSATEDMLDTLFGRFCIGK